MAQMKHEATGAVATLIGDVVGSRAADSRRGVHDRLTARLGELGELVASEVVGRPRVTVGDEYQASFVSVGAALSAARWLRLALLPDVDVRQGIGWGPVEELSADPLVEDGPGWWAARDALDAVQEDATRAGGRRRRTGYRPAAGVPGPDPGAVNAALVLRDELTGGLSERSLSVLRGLLSGRTQKEIADKEGITASAVSQRVRHDGLAAIVASDRLLGGIR